MTHVTRHEGETWETTFRRSDEDEFGYEVPEQLIARLEAAQREVDAARAAIEEHVGDREPVWLAEANSGPNESAVAE